MAHNSPPLESAGPSLKPANRARLRAFILAFFERTKALLQAQQASSLADKTCTVYLGKTNKDSRNNCRQALQTRFYLKPEQLNHFFRTSLGADLLARFSKLVHLSDAEQGQQTLQGTLVATAAEPEGLSLLTLLHKITTTFPLNTNQVLFAAKRLAHLIQATNVMVSAIRDLAKAEVNQAEPIDFATLPDLRRQGNWSPLRQELTFTDASRDRTFQLLLYIPQGPRSQQTPVIVMSHGLGSRPEDLEEYAEHLTSHGFAVVVPQHPGSDASHVRKMLDGHSNEVFQTNEFIDRPLDVTYVLDQLAQWNTTDGQSQLNLESVGIIGHSFGGYTALALAGASIHFDKLEAVCDPVRPPNFSLFLQCRALGLPRQAYPFRDRRIKAVFVVDPVGSEVFGPNGLRQVEVPVFITAGTEDRTTPAALEQIRIFPWLASRDRYLSVIEGKSHVNDLYKLMAALEVQLDIPTSLVLPDPAVSDTYINALSLAFFETYVAGKESYRAYLHPQYASYIDQPPFTLSLISAASSEGLTKVLCKLGGHLIGEYGKPAASQDV